MHDRTVASNSEAHRSPLRARGLIAALTLAIAPLMGAAPPGPGQAVQANRVAVGDEAADFSLQSIDGETHDLAGLRGEKNAIIIFFRGTW